MEGGNRKARMEVWMGVEPEESAVMVKLFHVAVLNARNMEGNAAFVMKWEVFRHLI